MRDEKGRFIKGNIPWHIGMKGLMLNTGKTHFKKGVSLNPYPKGHIPWNKGMKGLNIGSENPFFGKHHTQESINKIVKTHKGIYLPNKEERDKKHNWMKNKRNRMKRGNGGIHTYEEWLLLKSMYENMCLCCKQQEPHIKLTEDHIIPISKGGSDNIENIQPLCMQCNLRKMTKIVDYKELYYKFYKSN